MFALFHARLPRLMALAAALVAAGCTVGPDYRSAPQVAANTIDAGKFPHAPVAADPAAPRVAEWWRALGDDQLDRLIDTALRQSPCLLYTSDAADD